MHRGSGLGNQLHRYVAVRTLALDKGYDFGMVASELFKGKDFMNLDMGSNFSFNDREIFFPYAIENGTGKVSITPAIYSWTEAGKGVGESRFGIKTWEEWNKNVYDPDINFVEDNTIIDGNFEDPRYFEHRLPEINEWLKTEPLLFNEQEDTCLIGFRGGEYYTVSELGLPKEYFDRAIIEMRKINPKMRFEVHTDDLELARKFFPDFIIFIRDIEINWRAMRYAKFAIIANSSFYVLPRLLADNDSWAITIAPRYWNRYNIKEWQYPQNFYKQFRYI